MIIRAGSTFFFLFVVFVVWLLFHHDPTCQVPRKFVNFRACVNLTTHHSGTASRTGELYILCSHLGLLCIQLLALYLVVYVVVRTKDNMRLF